MTEDHVPEWWLCGCVPGDDEPVLLECGTRKECEERMAELLSAEGDQYQELFLLAVVQYASYLVS